MHALGAASRDAARVEIIDADPLDPAALDLLAEAAAEMRGRYPELIVPAAPPPTNAPLVPGAAFVLARLIGPASIHVVGCGALRPMQAPPERCAEVCRIFVTRTARRQGIARALMHALHARAMALGYLRLRLETGDRQPEACALYRTLGYAAIAPFGPHVDDPTSRCFEKALP